MKEKLTTYERRENIKLYLMKERGTTATQLAFLFDVSRQTIMNDIVFLSSRIPIITKTGDGGGIFLDMEYHFQKVYLTEEEENLLLRLLDSLCEKEKKILINVINKFSMPDKK